MFVSFVSSTKPNCSLFIYPISLKACAAHSPHLQVGVSNAELALDKCVYIDYNVYVKENKTPSFIRVTSETRQKVKVLAAQRTQSMQALIEQLVSQEIARSEKGENHEKDVQVPPLS